MKLENTIYSFISLLEDGYQKVIDSDYKEPSLITSLNLLGQDVEFNFNYWLDDGLNSNFNHLDITVKLKGTGELICNINIVIIDELFQNSWGDIYEDCYDDAVHLRDTFEKIFFCDDDDFIDLSKYLEYNEDDFLSHENCPIWINLNHIEITEKHRGKGYGQEILKYIINLLGLNSEYTVSKFYTSDDIVLSVFPYPINLEIDCPIENFDLTLKMVQKFYKKIGFKEFNDRGVYTYNKNNI